MCPLRCPRVLQFACYFVPQIVVSRMGSLKKNKVDSSPRNNEVSERSWPSCCPIWPLSTWKWPSPTSVVSLGAFKIWECYPGLGFAPWIGHISRDCCHQVSAKRHLLLSMVLNLVGRVKPSGLTFSSFLPRPPYLIMFLIVSSVDPELGVGTSTLVVLKLSKCEGRWPFEQNKMNCAHVCDDISVRTRCQRSIWQTMAPYGPILSHHMNT